MKQIILSEYRREDSNSIIGKTIKDISFTNGDYENDSQLIITFTDDTYIFLKVEIDEDNFSKSYFENGYVESTYFPGSICIDEKGNKFFRYKNNIEEQIRLGLIKPDREMEMKKLQEYEESIKEREYKLYLELKKKYG